MIPSSEWVIQPVVGPRADERGSEPRHLPWAGYTWPMTGDRAMRALCECELQWPHCKFRAHPIDDDSGPFVMVGAGISRSRPTGL